MPETKAENMNNTIKRALTGVGATLAIAGLSFAGASAPAFADNASANVTNGCTAGVNTIQVDLTGYRTTPAQPEHTERVLVSAEVLATEDTTVRGHVITPAIAAVDAVTVTEWEFAKQLPNASGGKGNDNDGKQDVEYKWFDGKGPNDASVWTKTGNTRIRVISPAVPAQDEVRAPDVVTPGIPYQAAVWADIVTPAVPGDDTPNALRLYIDGAIKLETDFGTGYSDSLTVDGTITHLYELVVTTPDQEETVVVDGVTDACARVVPGAPVPPVDPKPQDPTVPADPTTPTVPADPTTPTVPDDPTTPTVPAAPTTPTAPAAVVTPTPAAVKPVTPANTGAAGAAKVAVLASTGTSHLTVPALIAAMMMALAGVAALSTARRAKGAHS